MNLLYADCEDYLTQVDCESSDHHCEWHADEGLCEDEAHDHEHCDELSQAECEASSYCEWHDHGADSACEELSNSECAETDHANVDGLVIEHLGEEIYRQFQGLIEGRIEVPANITKDMTSKQRLAVIKRKIS